jgi:hypothetical protein
MSNLYVESRFSPTTPTLPLALGCVVALCAGFVGFVALAYAAGTPPFGAANASGAYEPYARISPFVPFRPEDYPTGLPPIGGVPRNYEDYLRTDGE